MMFDPLSGLPLRRCPVAVVDFETTGRDPTSCQPVSVAVAHMELGLPRWQEVLHTRINPGVPIPAEATAVHGITDEMVTDAPGVLDVLGDLLPLLEGRIFMAYNATYDWQVLGGMLGLAGTLLGPFHVLDPFVWVKAVDKYERGKKLVDVVARRGLQVGEAHDAMADVVMTAQVSRWLLRDLKAGGHAPADAFDDLGQFLSWQAGAALMQEADYAAYRARKGQEAPSLPWHDLLGCAPKVQDVLDEAASAAGRGAR